MGESQSFSWGGQFLVKSGMTGIRFMKNRRQFLSGCSTLALAAAFSPDILAAAVSARDTSSEQLSHATFSKYLGSTFVVRQRDNPATALELIRARQLSTPRLTAANATDAGHEGFALMFRTARGAALVQNTYSFEHREMGRFQMFIVPVGVQDETHDYFQAIFNRQTSRPGRGAVPPLARATQAGVGKAKLEL